MQSSKNRYQQFGECCWTCENKRCQLSQVNGQPPHDNNTGRSCIHYTSQHSNPTFNLKPNTTAPHVTITTTSSATAVDKGADPQIAELLRQIEKFAEDAWKASAGVQGNAKGQKRYYPLRNSRIMLKYISHNVRRMRRGRRRSYLKQLQIAIDTLTRHARPHSIFAQFAREHTDDIAAFDVAFKLLEDGDEPKTWRLVQSGTKFNIQQYPRPRK